MGGGSKADKDFTEIQFSFRMNFFRENEMNSFLETCKKVSFTKRFIEKKSFYVISTDLKKGIDYSCLITALKVAKPEKGRYDIFVSVVTEYDSRIIDVPDWVEQFAKRIDAPYVFSFTVV